MTKRTLFVLAALVVVPTAHAAPDGKALFQQTCVACHAPTAKGAFPGIPDLTRKGGPLTKSDAELIANVLNGYQSKGSPMAMPPKGGNPALTAEDVAAIVAYLKSLAEK